MGNQLIGCRKRLYYIYILFDVVNRVKRGVQWKNDCQLSENEGEGNHKNIIEPYGGMKQILIATQAKCFQPPPPSPLSVDK